MDCGTKLSCPQDKMKKIFDFNTLVKLILIDALEWFKKVH
jgi:hypothetical protein